jgi:hypothetical protein
MVVNQNILLYYKVTKLKPNLGRYQFETSCPPLKSQEQDHPRYGARWSAAPHTVPASDLF